VSGFAKHWVCMKCRVRLGHYDSHATVCQDCGSSYTEGVDDITLRRDAEGNWVSKSGDVFCDRSRGSASAASVGCIPVLLVLASALVALGVRP
jgi:hypothetical protein